MIFLETVLVSVAIVVTSIHFYLISTGKARF
ncbi:hypothetical protein CLU93_3669 [Janthinobacterium sp. 35]|jgi:hypothetical protein|nr:hypothetical protein CLU93_3669 [Janthinobacterium sp. 35]PVX37782.1 hypothetical protein C8C92_4440 [Janthinobacterium sp. 78]